MPEPEVEIEALPAKKQHALSDAGLLELLIDNGGFDLTRLEAAAAKMDLTRAEKAAIKTRLIDLGLLRAG